MVFQGRYQGQHVRVLTGSLCRLSFYALRGTSASLCKAAQESEAEIVISLSDGIVCNGHKSHVAGKPDL